ncbi:MAG: helix-turn-helix transcriptional regulator [Oscillospiraceae bacterium]|nr:helix-turn-helix transcriptional regulator [Oscillospiraceae bacterium]
MTVDVKLLESTIGEKGMTIEEFSKAIGINPSTYYRKKEKGCLTFSVGQMHSTVEVLNLTPAQAVAVFLNENSH